MVDVDLSCITNPNYKPNLFDVHRILEQWIVGEHESRLAVFTNWILGQQNCMISGQRSSGKTFMVDNMCKLLSVKNGMYNLSAGSEKSAWYQVEKLKGHTYIVVSELNKLPKGMLEILKDWGEGKDSVYKTVVFESGQRRTQEFTLPRRPYIFCLADEEEMKIDDQLRSRLTVIRSDDSEAQNVNVLNKQAMLAMLPQSIKVVDTQTVDDLRLHLTTLPLFSKSNFIHPAAQVFVEAIPTTFTDCRRDFPKYLSNTYGITRFFWKKRINYVEEDKTTYLVTPEDMYYNHIIYGNILKDSALRCTNIEKKILDIVQINEVLNRTQIQNKLRGAGLNISAHMVSRHLNILTDLGYTNSEKIGSQPANYRIGTLIKEFQFLIDWDKVIQTCKDNMTKYYPVHSQEYIEKHCGDIIMVTNPYTGVEVNLRDIKPEKKIKPLQSIEQPLFQKNEDKQMIIEEEVIVSDEDILAEIESDIANKQTNGLS